MEKVAGKITAKDLKKGDLLFTVHPSCDLSRAIDLVTRTAKGTRFSHIGIVEREVKEVRVYHSTPKAGVCCESLEQFVHPDEKDVEVMVYRLKKEYLKYIPAAIESAKGILGERYNHSFRFTEQGYYCSEFIYRIFAHGDIFELNPMTFKDPDNKEFLPQWVEYYNRLGISIPERQPGCNPNGMASSDKLELVGELKT